MAKTKQSREYERAKRRALARLKRGFDLGITPPKSRDELHDREAARKPLMPDSSSTAKAEN
jgi:ferritin-like protein